MDITNKIDEFLLEDDIKYWEDALIESLMDFIAMLDLDDLSECQIEKLDEAMELIMEDEFLSEQVGRVKRVVRQGKKIRRKFCKTGYKLQNGKCVKMSQQEKRKRSKSARRSAKKKRGQKASIQRKRSRSIRRK